MKKPLLFITSFTLCLFIKTLCFGQIPKFNWSRSVGGTSDINSTSVAVDASGNSYTAGYFQGTADFDPGPGVYNLTSTTLYDYYSSFISKLDSSGKFVWAKTVGGSDTGVVIKSIAVDSSGQLYIAANVLGHTSISKLDSSGNFSWTKYIGTISQWSNTARPSSIAIDRSGNIVTTGLLGGTVDFDPGEGTYDLTGSNPWDTYIFKLDSSGNFKWARVMGSNDYDESTSVAVDDLGDIYTTGTFRGSGDFDPGPGTHILTCKGFENSFISKLDSFGNFLWAKSIGDSTSTGSSSNSIAIDKSGSVYSIGAFAGTVDFDPGVGNHKLTSRPDFWDSGSNSSSDAYVSKLDTHGNFLWAINFGSRSGDFGKSVALDAAGNIYTTGVFYDTADFDAGPGTYNLIDDRNEVFISKFDASGNFIDAVKTNASDFPNISSMIVDKRGNVYLVGPFTGTMDFDNNAATNNSLTSVGLRYYDMYLAKFGHIPFVNNYTWTGNADSNWNNPANWSCNCIPVQGSNISIPSGTASLNGDFTLEKITLQGSLNLNGHTLTINATVTGAGSFIGSPTSSMIINGTADPLNFSPSGGRLLSLQINAGAVVNIPRGTLIVGP